MRSLSDKRFGDLDELLLGVLLESEGDIGGYWILRAAEQPPDGFLVIFPLDIPEGDIDGAHRRAPHPCLSPRVKCRVQLVPDALRFNWILATQKRRGLSVDELPGAKTLRCPGKSVARDTLIGFDGNKNDRRPDLFFKQGHVDRNSMESGSNVSDLHMSPHIFFREPQLQRMKSVSQTCNYRGWLAKNLARTVSNCH